MNFLEKVDKYSDAGQLPPKIADTLRQFYNSYKKAVEQNRGQIETCHPVLNQFLDEIIAQLKSPFMFSPNHQKIISPFDYFQFGKDFIRPLVQLESSKVLGLDRVNEIESHLARGENVVLFANHQTEPDPQAINLLLENTHPELTKKMIVVAGHRVTTDPLAVPLSKGLNLLCIYSKNYIEHPPEEKYKKVLHNQYTMRKMRKLLSEGGKCIYVAPSGGRDRRDETGHVEVAPFDPKSIEMFRFTAIHASRPTHFYPLALATYDLLPPPNSVYIGLGEHRLAQCTPISLAFGSEIDMTSLCSNEQPDKKAQREVRAQHIWELVKELYSQIRV